MKYIDSITDILKLPNYIKSIALASLVVWIPIVGQMLVLGWLIHGFWGRNDRSPSTFPEFDFGQFGFYLQRGLWPYLVLFAGIFAAWIAAFVIFGIPSMIINTLFGKSSIIAGLFNLTLSVVSFAYWIIMMVAIKPLKIRATLTQDFAKSFDLPFIQKFIQLTWQESLLSVLMVMVASIVLLPLGILAVCVGVVVALTVLFFATEHLDRQLYQLYLSRGGEAVPVSPLLSDTTAPPPPPVDSTI